MGIEGILLVLPSCVDGVPVPTSTSLVARTKTTNISLPCCRIVTIQKTSANNKPRAIQ